MPLIHCAVLKPLGGFKTTKSRQWLRHNEHPSLHTWKKTSGEQEQPNGCRGRLAELILVSALLLGNLHKLVPHHFLKQTNKHT